MLNIGQDVILDMHIAVPPRDEQMKIVCFVRAELGRLDLLRTECERAIVLLKERRSALITAAVTGQIDVRGTT